MFFYVVKSAFLSVFDERSARRQFPSCIASRPTPSDSGSDRPGSGFIDANGSLLKAGEIDLSQPLVILEVSPKETESADETQTMYVSVPVSILMDIANQNPDFQLEIQAPYGSYILPAALPSLIAGWDELLEENDWQAENISFKLTLTDRTDDADIRKVLSLQLPSGKLVGAIVNVHLEIVDIQTGETLTEVSRFTEPIIRMIPISKELAPESTTWGAFRYDETSGQFVFVPARLEQRDDRLYAVIRSNSNSVYVVVSNAINFTDTEQHWGKAYVEQAAAKGLVHGTGDGKFAPDKVVTRAEFAAMLVRALGPVDSSMSRDPAYEDVQPGAWYYSEVMQAKELGLLDFVEGDRLLPNQPLTREEMARMVAAAVRSELQSLPEKPASLAVYRDQAAMDEAYLEDIQLMVTLGIMTGTGSAQFSPKGEATRAQAAIVLLRTLAAMSWID
jgi:hypothetical protein